MRLAFEVRRCKHPRNDNSDVNAIEIHIEIGRFCSSLVFGI